MRSTRIFLVPALLCLMTTLGRGQSVEQLPEQDSLPAKQTDGDDAATPPKIDVAEVAAGIVKKTNEFRVDQGLSAVSVDADLEQAAVEFAQYMAETQRYGHTADGRRPSERATAAGYEYCIVLENIAYRYQSRKLASADLAEHFFEGWKNSPEHRHNMLDPAVTETGVGVAVGEDQETVFAVQMFGRPQSAQITISVMNDSGATVQLRATAGDSSRQFELPPRTELTMKRCRPTELTLVAKDGESEASSIRVAESAQLVIESEGDSRSIVRRASDE